MTEEHLSDDVLNKLTAGGKCPDCKGELLCGPEAGATRNYKCEDCRHEFWLSWHAGFFAFGGRVDRDDPSLYGLPRLSELLRKIKGQRDSSR